MSETSNGWCARQEELWDEGETREIEMGCGSSDGDGGGRRSAQNINAAGATFPYPIYNKWFTEYHSCIRT